MIVGMAKDTGSEKIARIAQQFDFDYEPCTFSQLRINGDNHLLFRVPSRIRISPLKCLTLKTLTIVHETPDDEIVLSICMMAEES